MKWSNSVCRIGFLLASIVAPRPGIAIPVRSQASIPTPPQQHTPWAPAPASLPPDLVRDIRVLFDQGLADPRGCEYRSIRVSLDGAGVDGLAVPTYGWVLPPEKGREDRFAICWNGIVYRVTRMGEPADIANVANQRPHSLRLLRGPSDRFYNPAAPLLAPLLLRLGRSDLVEAVWPRFRIIQPDSPGLPYLDLSVEWLRDLTDAALAARASWQDGTALQLLQQVDSARRAVLHTAQVRGIPTEAANRANLQFLTPIPALLADQERRSHEAPPPHVLKGLLDRIPSAHLRVVSLIRDLEDASGEQSDNYLAGEGDGPIVSALVAQGDAAVPPLLDVLRSDSRLTRIVTRRTWGRDWTVRPVCASAYQALRLLLYFNGSKLEAGASSVPTDPAWRREAISTIGACWNSIKALPRPERWYHMLADDAGESGQWLSAAEDIAQPAALPVYFGGRSLDLSLDHGPFLGDNLRIGHSPSVSVLMNRRVMQILARTGDPQQRYNALLEGALLAIDLARWDPKGSLPALRGEVNALAEEPHNGENPRYYSPNFNVQYIAILTEARVRAGDTSALRDYARWVRLTAPATWTEVQAAGLDPLWKYASNPDIASAANWLFNAPDSSWMQSETPSGPDERLLRLAVTPLLRSTGYRRRILSGLADRTPTGTAVAHGSIVETTFWNVANGAEVSTAGAHNILATGSYGDGAPPGLLADKPATFRRCDRFARDLSSVPGMPLMELYWPEPLRDAAVARCRYVLQHYGSQFWAKPGALRNSRDEHEAALPAFPPLSHPATLEDVRQGRAIFSLAGEGKVRVVPLPSRPLEARWTTLTDYPQVWGSTQNGKPITIREYDQAGWVWQAEEVWTAAGWKRYYGFVGAHRFSRVPADEIEFTGYPGWWPLTHSLGVRLDTPLPPSDQWAAIPLVAGARTEAPLKIWLRSSKGIDQVVPSIGPGAPCQVIIHLEYAPFDGVNPVQSEQLAHDPTVWSEVRTLKNARILRQPARTLHPTDSLLALRINLRDLFALNRPGAYRCQVEFTGAIQGKFFPFEFRVASRADR